MEVEWSFSQLGKCELHHFGRGSFQAKKSAPEILVGHHVRYITW